MLVLQATPDKTEGLCEDTAAVEAFDATSPPKERAWMPILYLPQFFRPKITEKRPGNAGAFTYIRIPLQWSISC